MKEAARADGRYDAKREAREQHEKTPDYSSTIGHRPFYNFSREEARTIQPFGRRSTILWINTAKFIPGKVLSGRTTCHN
jgi:hypothetical protein